MTNSHFKDRVADLAKSHLAQLGEAGSAGQTLADPIVPPLTPEDTALYPNPVSNTYIAYASPWIDLASRNPVIASISRQVLNLEIAYASFCGVRSVVVPGPRRDGSKNGGNQGLAQYGRALQEALSVGGRLNFLVHMPMYREPGLEEAVPTLSESTGEGKTDGPPEEIDVYSAWDSWHVVRTICEYNLRLFVGEHLAFPR